MNLNYIIISQFYNIIEYNIIYNEFQLGNFSKTFSLIHSLCFFILYGMLLQICIQIYLELIM
jgi:hypothetical protein